MGTRPLRQHYRDDAHAPVRVELDPSLRALTRPWTTHRHRLLATVRDLPAPDWERRTRCERWSVKEVIGHLVVVDQFWTLTLANALAGREPTRMLAGFDPSSSTDALVVRTVDRPVGDLVESFAAGTAALVHVVGRFTDAAWEQPAESPLGHLPCHLLLAHALWDSWSHERDILVPVGAAPPVPAEELRAVTVWTLCFAGLEGGLLEDPEPVGPGLDAAVGTTLRFAELPDDPLHVRLDTGVAVASGRSAEAVGAGSAYDLVEGMSGRRPIEASLTALPGDLATHVARAAATL